MKKIFLLLIVFAFSTAIAQKYQRIAYIDMEYILENIPQYNEVQNTLNSKVEKWKRELDKENRAIETLKTDLSNEKAILTKDLIAEREEDILIKEESVLRLESMYFGPNGDLYNLRRTLIQPIQDQVYNTVQEIATRKKYDFVFDKSGDLVMLYSNKKHDISDLVLKLIGVEQKKQSRKEKLEEKKKLLDEAKTKKQQKAQAKKDEKKKLVEERRKKLLEAREKKLELLRKKREELRKKREKLEKLKNEKSK